MVWELGILVFYSVLFLFGCVNLKKFLVFWGFIVLFVELRRGVNVFKNFFEKIGFWFTLLL